MEQFGTGEQESLDRICGCLEIYQAANGYRFGVEALLLCGFVKGRARRLADLGSGSGILSLVLVRFGKAERATAVEIQPQLAERSRRSVERNGLSERIQVFQADLRRLQGLLPAGAFDLVVSNPPHAPAGTGRPSPRQEKALAKSELSCTLSELLGAARRLLRPGGRLTIIHLAARLPEALACCQEMGLRPSRLRLVHGRAEKPARHFLLEAVRGGRMTLRVEPALVVHRPDGSYTEEVQAMLYPQPAKDDRGHERG